MVKKVFSKTFFIFFVLILITPTESKTATRTIHVIDDAGEGVECNLYKITAQGKLEMIGSTGNDGICEVETECESGERIKVMPIGNYLNTIVECIVAFNQKIKVTKQPLYANLETNLEYFIKTEDYAKTALILNELYSRSIEIDESVKWKDEGIIYEYFGKFLEVENPTKFDPIQGKVVISPEFKKAIEEYQKKKELDVTGQLDYGTLASAAGSSIGEYIFRERKNF